MTMSTTPEMVPADRSFVPKWLWDQLSGYRDEVLVGYFRGRNLEGYYAPGVDPVYLEELVGTLAWSRALTAWSLAVTRDGSQRITQVRPGGPITDVLAGALTSAAEQDEWAVTLEVDAPGPAAFQTQIWGLDWWHESLGVDVAMVYERGPDTERLHRAVALASVLGARVMIPGTLEGTDREAGLGLRLAVEGIVVDDVAGTPD